MGKAHVLKIYIYDDKCPAKNKEKEGNNGKCITFNQKLWLRR